MSNEPSHNPLRTGALGTREVVLHAVSHLGPAIGVVVIAPVLATFVGLSVPLVLLLAMAAVLLTGLCVAALAKHLPSAGGFYTYVSHGLGERAGFVTAWAYFLYDPLIPTLLILVTSGILEPALDSGLGLAVPWWIIALVLLAIVQAATHRGVKLSARLTLAVGLVECAIMVAFAVAVLAHTGSAGLSLDPFAFPDTSGGYQPIFLAFAFGVLLFTGFESAAPLAEETADPRRTIPRTVIWSILIVGLIWVLAGYAMVAGLGADRLGELGADDNAFFVLADELSGWAWIFLAFALLNSALAGALAGQNAGARVIYALGRAGILPARLAWVHPKHRTPAVALGLVSVINLVVTLGIGAWLGPIGGFTFIGLFVTLGVIVLYILGNLSVIRLYRTRYRTEWNVVRHALVPIVASICLGLGLYYSVWPFPAWPLNIAAIAVATWLTAGVAASLVLWRTRRHQLTAAAQLLFDGQPAVVPAPSPARPAVEPAEGVEL